MSSMCWATCANSSLTSMPLSPYLRNLNGEGKAAPVLRSVRRFSRGNGLPAYFSSSGLGSKVSTCEGPPLAKMCRTRCALAGKCGFFGASGDTVASVGAADTRPCEAMSPARPSEAKPMPERQRKSRRVRGNNGVYGLTMLFISARLSYCDDRLCSGIQTVHRQFQFLAIAVESGRKILQETGKPQKGMPKLRRCKTYPCLPFPPFLVIRDSQRHFGVP